MKENIDNNPIVEIENFLLCENKCVSGNKSWNVSTLIKACDGLEPYNLQLSALNIAVPFPDSSSISSFCFQMKRTMDADLSVPIIQAPDGWIMDGYHRIAKAIYEGKTTLPAYRLKVLPDPDETLENN